MPRRRHPALRRHPRLEQAGFRLIAAGLTYCVQNPTEAEAGGYPIEAVEKMFMSLG